MVWLPSCTCRGMIPFSCICFLVAGHNLGSALRLIRPLQADSMIEALIRLTPAPVSRRPTAECMIVGEILYVIFSL